MKTEKLKGKDLINIGIFTAIYFVVVFAVAMLGYIPVLMALLCLPLRSSAVLSAE